MRFRANSAGMVCAGFLVAVLSYASAKAAPDFKFRYNPKFPCVEVMDGKAVKITDISEGTQSEVVSDGKASIKLSFLKNESGQPEVTLTEAKSNLSEMELEAFGLAVGMKPQGVVTVRFGADHKPQFQMDRTGGSRFLMADLGNLDTAAGKDLTAAAGAPPTPRSLIRFRERLEEWKTSKGKGGWSNRPGKIIACGKDARVTYTANPERILLDGEAVQLGAVISAVSSPISFQSGPGVYHQLLAGGKAQLARLEPGQKDIKVTLLRGTLLTQIINPLAAPRLQVCGIGDGVVIQSSDGLFQVTRADGAETRITVAEGSLRLVEEAGAAQVGEAGPGTTLVWPSEKSGRKAGDGVPEIATLIKLKADSRREYLIDMMEDAIKTSAAETEEILRSACTAEAAFAKEIALSAFEIRQDLRDLIAQVTGIGDLPPAAAPAGEAESFSRRVQPWLRAEPGPTSCVGRILWLEGKATYADGLELKRGMILKEGQTIKTGGDGKVILLAAPGVVAEVQPGTTVRLVEMVGEFQASRLTRASAILDVSQGKTLLSIAGGRGDTIQAELRTPQGISRAKSSPAGTTRL